MKYALLTLSFLLTTVAFAHSQTSISSSYFGQHMELLGGLWRLRPLHSRLPLREASSGPFASGIRPTGCRLSQSGPVQLERGQRNCRDFAAEGDRYDFYLGHLPPWASTKPTGNCAPASAGSCYPPTDSAWTAFVTATVRQLRVIKYYELWNEANLSFYNGTPAESVHLASLAYPIIKSTANCSVGGTNPNQVFMRPSATCRVEV